MYNTSTSESRIINSYMNMVSRFNSLNVELSFTNKLDQRIVDALELCMLQLKELYEVQSAETKSDILVIIHSRIENKIKAIREYMNKKGNEVQMGDCDVMDQCNNSEENILLDIVKRSKTITRVNGFKDVAGLTEIVMILKCIVLLPIRQPQLVKSKATIIAKCILLFGPPGTGKSRLVHAIASEANADLYCINSSHIMGKYIGQSEKMIKAIFDYMSMVTKFSILFIDEVDGLCRKRTSNESDHDRRVKTELMIQLTKFEECRNVILISATNCPWELDEAFMRRYQKHLYVPLPSKSERRALVELFSRNTTLIEESTSVQWQTLLDLTDGYSGSDLHNLVQTALTNPLMELQRTKHWVHVNNIFRPMESEDDCSSDIIFSSLDELPENSVRARLSTFNDLIVSTYTVKKTTIEDDILKYSQFIIRQ